MKQNQIAIKSARKSVKRRITSDSEDEATDRSPTRTPPSAKRRRKSTTVEMDSGDESPLTSPPPLPNPGKKRKQQIGSDYEDADVDSKPSTAPKRPKLKKFDLKRMGRPKVKPVKDEVITAKNEGIRLKAPLPSSQKKQAETEHDMDIDVTSVANSVPTPEASHANPPKKKYPTIKKKPKVDKPTASTAVSPAPQVASKPPANAEATKESSVPAATKESNVPAATKESNVPATILNPSGTGDFDLRDSSTWQSLIGKSSSTAGPKVGIEKRVSTEERRRQLDKARDEARAQRERDFKNVFDLQAQSQKIGAFEKRLSLRNVKMHGPSVVGAAFLLRPLLSENQASTS